MKLSGFLNLKGISGQIAALVVASIVAIHLIITATFLIHRPDQFDPVDRPRAQPARGHSPAFGARRPAAERARLLADIAQAFPQLDIADLAAGRRSRRGGGG